MEKNIQAFPTQSFKYLDKQTDQERIYLGSGGMTLRDYFAGKALSGIVRATTRSNPEDIATACYKMADAMLEERGKE